MEFNEDQFVLKTQLYKFHIYIDLSVSSTAKNLLTIYAVFLVAR